MPFAGMSNHCFVICRDVTTHIQITVAGAIRQDGQHPPFFTSMRKWHVHPQSRGEGGSGPFLERRGMLQCALDVSALYVSVRHL